jgi:hypothetical protein
MRFSNMRRTKRTDSGLTGKTVEDKFFKVIDIRISLSERVSAADLERTEAVPRNSNKLFRMMVARGGVEPRRQPFQYYRLIRLVFLQLNFAEWPQFCDHSVTSADVRLSVGPEIRKPPFHRTILTPSPLDLHSWIPVVPLVSHVSECSTIRTAFALSRRRQWRRDINAAG